MKTRDEVLKLWKDHMMVKIVLSLGLFSSVITFLSWFIGKREMFYLSFGLVFGLFVGALALYDILVPPREPPEPPRPRKALKPSKREGNVIFLEEIRPRGESLGSRKAS